VSFRTLLAVAASVSLSSGALYAQSAAGTAAAAKPNFSGSWTLIADSASGGQRNAQVSAFAGLGTEATITQDSVALTVSRSWNGVVLKSVFNLDGSVTQNSLPLGPDSAIPLTARARWEGSKFMTTMSASFGGQDYALTMNLVLDASGTLVVDMTTPPMGDAPTAFTMKYRKNNQ
jgi:hypothetical protein